MPIQKKALLKLGILTIEDLLYHFPIRYGNTSEMKNINSLIKGETAVVFGKISGLKTSKAFIKKIPMSEAKITDDTGNVKCIWFHQPYLAKMFAEESFVRIEGKVSQKKSGEMYFTNPKMEKVGKLPIGVGDSLFGKNGEKHTLYSVYPESRGITSNWIYHAIQKIFKSGILDTFIDSIPKELLQKYNLPTLKSALIWIHAPLRSEDAQSARKRFAFEEVFYIQIAKQQSKIDYQKNPSFIISKDKNEVEDFVKRFPFEATNAQRKAVEHILQDFKIGHAMSRLLHGDVGSGKTAVAAVSAYAVVTNKLQVAYMCPTEILAKQHFESFIKYFSYLNIQIGLITGSGCRKFPSKINPKSWTDISRTQLLKWVANGEIHILIGTHSLIQKTVKFKKLAYVIIDEQHRFGTNQRQKLAHKNSLAPHLLSMTATPIPRTLALTVYGDLDLTLLDEMPKGRKPIITEIVLPHKRDETYSKIKEELKNGRQLYVICPRINEPDPDKEQTLNVKSVIEEAKRLKKDIFPEYETAIMHSKMTTDEKEKVMIDFEKNKIQILIATSVVEVGVNVPNATIIIIEGGERFGLAQLHQFRGRVIRSNHQAYCYVFAESKSDKTLKRLKALGQAKNGFELAEFDLAQRGAGELYGRKQWGLSDVAMEAIKNIKMVEAARLEAARLLTSNESLSNYPLIKAHLAHHKTEEIHFE
ncbi:MAG: ATP-dependent DNA helicase RecG [Patescibacteria group bacterium]|nr:ATP-dependent DNA helicase RecG [Patescibacteria group bacterium]